MDPLVLLLLLLFFSGAWAQNSSAHTDVDCTVIHLKYVECLWKSPDVNYTFYSRFQGSSFRECDTYIIKDDHNVGCKQPEDNLQTRRFNTFETKLEWGEEARIQKHKLKNRDVDCTVIHLKYVECLWKSPDVNYTFYSRFQGSSFRECDTYIIKDDHNVGCKQPEDNLQTRRFNTFETKLEWGEEARIQKHKLKNRVKLYPPTNLTVQYRSDSNLWFEWRQIFTHCVESQVRYRVNANNWEVFTVSNGQDFCINLPSNSSFYELQVRSRVRSNCGQSEEWSDWSQPVMWSNRRGGKCSLREEELRADVMLLLDGFNHISPDDFSRVRDFLKTLLPMVGPLGPDLVRVSLVKCGRDPEVEFDLNTFHNLSSMVDAVSRVSQSPPLPGGSSHNAVEFIWRNIRRTDRGDRRKTPDLLILVTDRSSSGVDTDLLESLRSNDLKVFVVGVKVTDELQVIERDGDDDGAEIFTVEDYNSISNISELTQSMRRWLKEKLSRAQPESLRFTDVQPRRLRASWEFNSRRVQCFVLFVDLVNSESYVQLIFVLGHERSAEILHLLPNTSYRISVYALYSPGPSHSETGVVTTSQDGVRLRAGPGRCSGSVEVLMGGAWSSVCGRGFGLTEAAVVCAELDCGAVSELHQGALFTEGPAVGRSFHCDGAETSLKECESSETRCSAAAHLTCSDEVLRFHSFSCAGNMELRHRDEWRPVMTSEDLDLDFGSALCEQMGCGFAVELEYERVYSGPFWWLQPECVKQRSGLTNCLDLDSHMNETEGGLDLICSEFVPTVRASVSSEGASVSSEGTSRVQRVLLMLGTNFSVSCSLDKPFFPGQFHLLSPTGNSTLPSVSHSAHFLIQDFSPAHIGNYTCVFCDNVNITKCFKSTTLYVAPGGESTLVLISVCVVIIIIIIIISATVLTIYCKRRSREDGATGGGEGAPNSEREYENIRPESDRIYQDLRLEEMEPIYSDLQRR